MFIKNILLSKTNLLLLASYFLASQYVHMNKILLYIGLLLSVNLMRADVKDEMQSLREWKAGAVVSDKAIQSFGIDNCFGVDAISDAVFARMKGKSFKENSRISRSDLRYLRVLHVDNKGAINIGEMVCNQQIANDLVAIFRKLYEARYPIERMVLIDDYQADDETSMRANNTSCFNYRQVQGSNKLSKHAQGLAVDINTLYNPCVKRKANGTLSVQPSTAKKYVNRNARFPYKIVKDDLLYRLFIQHGFTWGGSWHSLKDYQHFEK